ncbi:MAG: ABC transporter ATP-binding protein [Anaerolineales bacterium]|nr:ABC transporter ATP-binding protein [Anaerolineales bacterium]
MNMLPRMLTYLRRYWMAAAGAIISLLLVNAANLATPQLLRLLIDRGVLALNMNMVFLIAFSLVMIAIVRGIFNFLQGYLSEVTSQGVAFDLRNTIFEKLQSLSFSYHDRSQTGKLMTRMTSDVDLVRIFMGNGLLHLLSGVILLLGTIVILFLMNWILATIFLFMIPVILLIMFVFVKRIMPISKRIQEKLGALNTTLYENLGGLRIVKAFAREDYEFNRFQVQNNQLLEENLQMVRTLVNFFPTLFFVANLGIVGIVWGGGIQVIGNILSLGELVAFIGYLGFFMMPMFMLGFIGALYSRAEASAQRIFEVIDAESEVQEKPGAEILNSIQGSVKFDSVTFRYIGAEEYILDNISFEVLPGQVVAILGKTGSGKSTIINLIPRFYDVTQGRVLIDGHDVRDVQLDSLRSQIGIVLQESTLLSGTIRENIAYGKPLATMDEVIKAAKVAQAHEFISRLPEGYDTLVGEKGVGLSGGQKQRIAIARGLLVDPRILILDDSTSAVDAQTEHSIQLAMQELMRGRTSFVIAQRISTIKNADLILVLENRRLVAMGTHVQLLETSEQYAEILETQFGVHAEPRIINKEGVAL